jgi:alpha-beta hydrolase superfamily lysophospholipase
MSDVAAKAVRAIEPARIRLQIDVTEAVALGEPAHVVAEVVTPDGDGQPLGVLFCTPGGGMTRRFFDLPTPAGVPEASFARAMAARGFAVVLIDPLGVGESSVPADPYLLGPDLMGRAGAAAVRLVLEDLRKGAASPDLEAWPGVRSIGVGHSYGALLSVVQQARDPVHVGLGLFGFHTAGLPHLLTPEELAVTPRQVRDELAARTRVKHPTPYLDLQTRPSSQPVSVAAASVPVLSTMSLISRTPGIVAEEAAAIDVPVFLVFGDKDIHGRVDAASQAYPNSPDVALLMLPDTRHNHFVYPNRALLFDRFAAWAAARFAAR